MERDEGRARKRGEAQGKRRIMVLLVIALVAMVACSVADAVGWKLPFGGEPLVGGGFATGEDAPAVQDSPKPSSEPFDPASYQQLDYATVAVDPDGYKDQKLYFVGTVHWVVEDDDKTEVDLATSISGYEDIVYARVDDSVRGDIRLKEGKALGIYGTCTGSYESTSAPSMVADQLDEDVKTPEQQMVGEVQEIFDKATFDKTDKGYGSYEYATTVTNTTGLDLRDVNVVFGLYDDSGTRVEEAFTSAYSWAAGESAVFDDRSSTDASRVKAEVLSFKIDGQRYSAQ